MARLSLLLPRVIINLSRSVATSSMKTVDDVPIPPKRPLTPFMAFCVIKRPEILDQKPDIGHKEVLQSLSSAWKSLTPDIKKGYGEQWMQQFLDFKIEHMKWWDNLSVEQKDAYNVARKETKKKRSDRKLKKQLRLLGKPRKPLTAFNFYLQANLNNIKVADHILLPDAFRKLAVSWKEMSDKDKKPFLDMESKGSNKYGKDMLAWEEKMVREGYEDLIVKRKSTLKPAEKMRTTAKSIVEPLTPSNKKTSK